MPKTPPNKRITRLRASTRRNNKNLLLNEQEGKRKGKKMKAICNYLLHPMTDCHARLYLQNSGGERIYGRKHIGNMTLGEIASKYELHDLSQKPSPIEEGEDIDKVFGVFTTNTPNVVVVTFPYYPQPKVKDWAAENIHQSDIADWLKEAGQAAKDRDWAKLGSMVIGS